MRQSSHHILLNINDLYQKLAQAHSLQLINHSKRNYDWYLRKGSNLKKYLQSKGLWIDEYYTRHNAEIFISNLEKELPKLNRDKLLQLKDIAKHTLQALQTGDLISFENIPIARGYPWPTATAEVIRQGVGKKQITNKRKQNKRTRRYSKKRAKK